MVSHWQDFGFCVKMVDGTHPHAASGNTEGVVLNSLESLNRRSGGIGKPDGTGIGEKEADKRIVG